MFLGVEHLFRKKFCAEHLSGVAAKGSKAAVLSLQVGYVGGTKSTADYETVCKGASGHAEALRVEFDPSRLTYRALVEFFFRMHDFTTVDKQGADVGTQYRSAIFCTTPTQHRIAADVMRRVQSEWIDGKSDATPLTATALESHASETRRSASSAPSPPVRLVEGQTVATKISMSNEWFSADEYHQRYLEDNVDGYQCPTHRVRTWPELSRPAAEIAL